MKIWKTRLGAMVLVIILLALPAASGCGGDSPGETVERHLQLLNQRHFDDFNDMHAEGYAPTASFPALSEDTFPAGAEISDIQVTDEQLDGDNATVRVQFRLKLPGSPDQEMDTEVKLVRENGVWKIAGGL